MASTSPEHTGSQVSRLIRSLWRNLLTFLEIIGLREEHSVEPQVQLAKFKLYHAEFRKLLTANNNFLEIIAELEQKKHEGDFFDLPYIKRRVARAVADIHLMVNGINTISSNRYPSLQAVLDHITAQLTGAAAAPIAAAAEDLVLDVSVISASHADIVGGKMAHLAEIRNKLTLPTPDGFTVTTAACQRVFENGEIKSLIQKGQTGLLSPAEVSDLSKELRAAILNSPLPPDIEAEMHAAYDRLAHRLGSTPRLAVRSSALGEDSTLSFAGQFVSVLNVTREGLTAAYKDVLASLFSPEAIHYRQFHGLSDEAAVMAVGCIAMVEAVVSGIVFSNNPTHAGQVLINSVWGLGVTLADGRTSPETILVSREASPRILSRRPSSQTTYLACLPEAGVVERPLEPEHADKPTITDAEAVCLARWALKLEAYFGRAQDIEWAIDSQRRIVLLQSRPLRMLAEMTRSCKPIEGRTTLLNAGDIACPGVGSGPAIHLDEDGDIDSFPEGGVLVARRSSPRFVRLMAKARAIVTDAGSITGHMASLAREFRVPTILNTKDATRVIPSGALVTVDATSGCVYDGSVEDAVRRVSLEVPARSSNPLREGGAVQLLEKVSDLIIPLNLTNPRSSRFTPENCKTLHDMARFIHEKSYEEMFRMGETMGDLRSASYFLDVFLPIDLYIVDLGGGVKPPEKGRKVKRSQVASIPLAALLKGMLHEKIPRFGPKPIDMGGLFSLFMRHAINNPEDERTFRDPCYALVSTHYLNYTSRVGYHFSVVDTYCSETTNKNYINLLFRGGAADSLRRGRRARAIADILKEHGFSVTVNRDLVTARLNKASRKETEERLEILGRLFQFMRQMDLAMSNDETAMHIKEAFLKGDYALEGNTD